ncbi:MAG: hypothetical protein GY765_11320 [bacterium]|nr:hypothetical protein [bacterium]
MKTYLIRHNSGYELTVKIQRRKFENAIRNVNPVHLPRKELYAALKTLAADLFFFAVCLGQNGLLSLVENVWQTRLDGAVEITGMDTFVFQSYDFFCREVKNG